MLTGLKIRLLRIRWANALARRNKLAIMETIMQDLVGLSGAAKEIVNAISRGVGTLYRPRAIRTEAEAEAYAIKIRARAEAEANIVASDIYEK